MKVDSLQCNDNQSHPDKKSFATHSDLLEDNPG